jgi:hypothetical protein
MATDEEMKETVMHWLNGLAANFCDEGIVKLMQCLDRCLNCKHMLYLVATLKLFY